MSIRINQGSSVIADNQRLGNTNQRVPSFTHELNTIEQDKKIELEALVKKLDDTGKRLLQNLSIPNLQEYKVALKNVLNKIAKNYGLSTENLLNHQGQSRILTSIRQIEQHLSDLSKDITANNANQTDILNKIDQIKGLIVDLYT